MYSIATRISQTILLPEHLTSLPRITFFRVPIFLGPVNEHELREAADTRAQLGLFEKDLHEELGDNVEDGDNYSYDSESQSPSRAELERMDSDMIMFEEEKEPTDTKAFMSTQATNTAHSSSSRALASAPASSVMAAVGGRDTKQQLRYIQMDTDMISFEDRDPVTNSPYRKTNTPTDGSPAKDLTAALSSKNLIEFEDIPRFDKLRGEGLGPSPSPPTVPGPDGGHFMGQNAYLVNNSYSECERIVPGGYSGVSDVRAQDAVTYAGINNTNNHAMPSYTQPTPQVTYDNTVPSAPPTHPSAATPYYGVTRGIVTPKESGTTDRFDALNGDIQQILSSMKGDGLTRPPEKPSRGPPEKPVRGPPKKPEKGPPMMKPEKALLLAAEKVLQIRSEKNSPIKPAEKSPIRVRKTSPVPVRSEKTSPIKVRITSPVRAEKAPERKVLMGILVISPPRSRSHSPSPRPGTKTQIPELPIAEPACEMVVQEKGFKEEKEVEVVEVKVEEKKNVEVEVIEQKKVKVIEEKEVEVEENEVVFARVKSCLSDDIPLPPVLPSLPPTHPHSPSSSSTPSYSESFPSSPSNRGMLEPNSEKENNRETKPLNNVMSSFGTKTLRSDSYDSAGSDHHNHYDVTDKAKPSRKGTGYAPPSSDPSVEVRYFGHQRVVIKKK